MTPAAKAIANQRTAARRKKNKLKEAESRIEEYRKKNDELSGKTDAQVLEMIKQEERERRKKKITERQEREQRKKAIREGRQRNKLSHLDERLETAKETEGDDEETRASKERKDNNCGKS